MSGLNDFGSVADFEATVPDGDVRFQCAVRRRRDLSIVPSVGPANSVIKSFSIAARPTSASPAALISRASVVNRLATALASPFAHAASSRQQPCSARPGRRPGSACA